jgi:hypothetical protein
MNFLEKIRKIRLNSNLQDRDRHKTVTYSNRETVVTIFEKVKNIQILVIFGHFFKKNAVNRTSHTHLMGDAMMDGSWVLPACHG